ncbi:unnamed protein product [Ilex paraguariensis]|uniref:RING-type domain-containing protein n=1 Tax=Ilex paraguariensis TaxID=185542 RepID=A0ABC8U2Q3_9AQUA
MTTLDREEHAGIGSEEKNSSKRTVMENLEKEFAEIAVEEEFPDEFQCCVCLDLLYKPVVLGCGHLSCFWCVFKAMDSWQDSVTLSSNSGELHERLRHTACQSLPKRFDFNELEHILK